jgi:hypothetical protein
VIEPLLGVSSILTNRKKSQASDKNQGTEEGPRTERISVPLPSVTGTNFTDVNIKQLLAE